MKNDDRSDSAERSEVALSDDACPSTPERAGEGESPCAHPDARAQPYVGSSETYQYCPDCMRTFRGEEGEAKRALIGAAARYDDLATPEELDELERELGPHDPLGES